MKLYSTYNKSRDLSKMGSQFCEKETCETGKLLELLLFKLTINII